MQHSVDVQNAILNAIETAIGTYPILEIRTGAPPANCAAASTGTLLASMTLPSDWMDAAASGSKSKSAAAWQDLTANATGTAGHYRLFDSTGATCHRQGTVGQSATAWASGHAYGLNDKVSNGNYVYICTTAGTSAGSGGPTGTGTGITDNTAVWDYLCPYPGELTFSNAQITLNELVQVTTWTITAGNS
jgi:hypothetical protein